MAKKKRIIYGLIFLIFFFLIFLYGLNVSASNRKNNLERLESAVAVSENSIRKSIEYQSKSILLDCADLNLERTENADEAAKRLKDRGMTSEGCYIVDKSGQLVMPGAELDGKRLDPTALQLAQGDGFASAGLLDLQNNRNFVTLLIPLNVSWKGYLAVAYTGNDFVTLVTENITLPNASVYLFDEWSNLVGTNQANSDVQEDSVLESLRRGAEMFNYDQSTSAFQPIEKSNEYNVYFNTSMPYNWFFGTRVSSLSQNESYFFNIPASSLFMFAVLIFLLGVVLFLDVMNERETKYRLSLVHTIDPLTGLFNASGMQEAMVQFLEKNHIKGQSLICVDIVSFSRINAMFGHSVGDLLLKTVSQVIQEKYFCGTRTNADCFVFLASPEDSNSAEMERRFFSAIEVEMGRQYLQMISFKFGMYPIESFHKNFQEIYDGALLALKSAKKHISKSEIVFDAQLQESMESLRNIEINMVHALSKEEFVVYVQPQIDLPEETCCRGETLIRWNSEFMGFMPPDKFIPVFENNGFIVETDFFMLNAAMQLVESRAKEGLPPLILAVNQSKVTITFPNYYERLQLLIETYPDAPLSHIELEVTESTLENDWGTIVPLIHSVKKLGFSIAMDDFGSGYSSLNTLRILPIDVLKIDKDFLQECDHSERCRTIIKNVIRLAKDLHIKIVCEGVESEMQLNFLKENYCDIAQGYFYSKPIPLTEFLEKYCEI